MLCLSTGWRLLSRAPPRPPSPASQSYSMYATRLYSTAGGGGGGGVKQGRRAGLAMAPPPHAPPPPYPLYQGRPDAPRGAHFHYHAHLAPPLLPHHYQHHAHFHAYGGGAPAGGVAPGSKKKTWNFIHEKMSYDTFFTMKRLIERSRRPDEVLRWVTQNPNKVSHNHYPVALQKIGQLLQATPPPRAGEGDPGAEAPGGEAGGGREILQHQDFHSLCDAIVSDCSKFDNFSVVNCLYAAAALGLPSDSQVVQVLEAESQSRLHQFNQKDVSMVFSSSMKLHTGSQHPLTEACLSGLERNLERERHPQTLFLLLAYYRLKWRSLQPQDPADAAGGASAAKPSPEQLLANRKILRLVKHTLLSVSTVRDQEMALLDEMLAACVGEASSKSLELIFSSQLFYQNRQERFISSLAEELPRKLDSITPFTMALIAKYVARHRLRETRLLDTIADFLVKKAEFLDSKVIQKLVFPFSRMSYRPAGELLFFSRLEAALQLKALSSPLATVNILMSLVQLGHFPALVLQRVFSSAFISNVTNSPYALIVRRYLSLLDAAVELEYPEYTGARLPDAHKVLMFDHAMTADEANRKYSYKGLVAEALRQLVGEQNYKKDEVLAPGYYTDFVLWMDSSGRVLPIRTGLDPSGPVLPIRTGLDPSGPVLPIRTGLDSSGPVLPIRTGLDPSGPVLPIRTGLDPSGPVLPIVPPAADEAVAVVTSEFQKFSPFSPGPGTNGGPYGPGTNGGPYGPYYPAAEFYSGLAKEPSLESQDGSTLSSPPSDGPAGAPGPSGATAPDSLFQFSIGKILEDAGGPEGPRPDQLPGFYEGVTYSEGPGGGPGGGPDVGPPPPQLHAPDRPAADAPPTDTRPIRRVIMSVNDKWHYCHNSEVLVGSRAMRDRHLRLLGYVILQLPYHELEKLSGIEQVKQYLQQKLRDAPR